MNSVSIDIKTGKVTQKDITVPPLSSEEIAEAESAQRQADLQATDVDMARIVEDLYNYIVDGTTIPQAVHSKIANRRNKRAAL